MTQVGDRALRALRLACRAAVASVQQNPMMCAQSELLGQRFFEFITAFVGRFGLHETGALAHAKDVRINRNEGLMKGNVQNHLGCLFANARQRHEVFEGLRNLTVEALHQRLGNTHGVFGLVSV